jgi:hypothetical protein
MTKERKLHLEAVNAKIQARIDAGEGELTDLYPQKTEKDELWIMNERLSSLIEIIHFGYFDNITRKQQLYLERILLIVSEFTYLNCYVDMMCEDKNEEAIRWDRD